MCGITNPNDAQAAAEAGASSIGIVAFESSPRFVPPSGLVAIRRALPPWVAITVVAPDLDVASRYDVDVYQLYSMPDIKVTKPLIHAIRANDSLDFDGILANYGCADALLFDAYHPHLMGGSGHRIDDSVAHKLFSSACIIPKILAGGLTPENVTSAVRLFRPWGVDVSSGIESSPGTKCHIKMKAFAHAVSQAYVSSQED